MAVTFDLDQKADTEMDWFVIKQKSILIKHRGRQVTSLVVVETEPVIQSAGDKAGRLALVILRQK